VTEAAPADSGTPIGRAIASSPGRAAIAAGVATGLVGFDMAGLDGWRSEWLRLAPGVVGLVLLLILARGDRDSLGLRVRALPSWRWWIRGTIAAGLIVGVVVLAASAVGWLAGMEMHWPVRAGDGILPSWWMRSVIASPLHEELLYRLVFCVSTIALLGRRPSIVLSGVVFAALHVVYGNPSPDNFSAGFVFAWAYFRSGTLLVPVMLHALGNACVTAWYVGYFWWTAG
jgi:uncharacterized protein